MNSPLVTYTNLTENCNERERHNKTGKITRITIHCTAGGIDVPVKNTVDYFKNPKTQCSSNYVVSGNDVGLSVEEHKRSWCSGGTKIVTAIDGTKHSGNVNDHFAVTIETASDTKGDYAVRDTTYNTLVKLVIDICKRNNCDTLIYMPKAEEALAHKCKDNEIILTFHRWFANKACPGNYLMSKMPELTATVNKALKKKMTYDELVDGINKLLTTYKEENL